MELQPTSCTRIWKGSARRTHPSASFSPRVLAALHCDHGSLSLCHQGWASSRQAHREQAPTIRDKGSKHLPLLGSIPSSPGSRKGWARGVGPRALGQVLLWREKCQPSPSLRIAVSLLDLGYGSVRCRYSIFPPGLQECGVLETKQDPPRAHERQK